MYETPKPQQSLPRNTKKQVDVTIEMDCINGTKQFEKFCGIYFYDLE